MPSIIYIAYPNSLNLRSANAIQTFTTLRELRRLRPDMLALIPRRDRTPSRFAEIGATHLLSPPVGKLSRLWRSTLPYYAERSLFAFECFALLRARGWRGGAVYVREAICAAWWAGVFGPLLGARVVYEAHDLETRNPSRAKERWAEGLLHLVDRVALTRSTAVVSLTDDFRRYLVQLGWRDAADVFVVPDAYDQTLFAPQDRATCRAALGIPADAELVAYTGMTFAYRWLEGLLEAAAQLASARPRLMLALVGGRPQEVEELRALAERLDIAGRVLLTGQLDQREVLGYSGAADALAIPDTVTDVTASPLKLFEYLALGQPIVLPDIPSLREIVPPELGHYFERRSAPALAAALAAALDCPGDPAARRALAAEHTYTRRAERILEVVGKVLVR